MCVCLQTSPELTPLSSSTPQLEDTVVFLDNQTLKDEYGAIAKIGTCAYIV